MSGGGINFHGDVGKVHTGEGDNVDGDKIMGDADKSQHSTTETNVAGDMHGDIKGGDNIQGGQKTLQELTKDFYDEMAKNAPELPESDVEPRAIPQASSEEEVVDTPVHDTVPDDVLSELEELDFTENEDHPQMVYSAIQNYEASGTVPSEEEQKGLFQRAFSCCKKYATSPEAKAIAETAAGAIEVVAGGLPFPANLSVFLLKKVAGK